MQSYIIVKEKIGENNPSEEFGYRFCFMQTNMEFFSGKCSLGSVKRTLEIWKFVNFPLEFSSKGKVFF